MVMSAQQIADELKRKKLAGQMPTNAANMSAYNAIKLPTQQKTTGLSAAQTKPKPAVSTPPTGQTAIRDFLKTKGVGDGQIGYSAGQVTVGGSGFATPATTQGGRAYSPTADLEKAWNSYQTNQGNKKVDSYLSNLEKAVSTPYAAYTPATPFSYDPASDPAYQAALQRAQANAQTAQNNAMVGLGARGIGNSSSAVSAANQIQQGAMSQVQNELVTSLLPQAYQRYMDAENMRYGQYMDQYGMNRDRIGDLGNLINVQSGLNNTLYNQGRDTIADLRYTDETAYSRGRDAIADTRYTDETKYARGRDAIADKRYDSETAYGRSRDAIADSRYTDELGYSRGRDAIEDARYDDETSYNRYRDSLADSQKSSDYSGLSSNQILDTLQRNYTVEDPSTGQSRVTADPDKRYQMFLDAVDMTNGMSDNEAIQVMRALGMTMDEINVFNSRFTEGK